MQVNVKRLSRLTAACLVLGAGSAMAAGFQINEMSPSLQGVATAGAAAKRNDVTAMAYNPATLATLKHAQAYVGASAIIPNVSYSNAKATYAPILSPQNPLPVTGNSTGSGVAPTAFVPAIYVGSEIYHGLYAGVAFTVPYGLKSQYDDNWVGRGNALKSSVKTYDIAPTLAYRVDQYISVGAALHVQKATVDYSNDIDVFTFGQSKAVLKGASWGVGYSLGILITPFKTTNIGVSYRSFVRQKFDGHENLTGFSPASATAKATIEMPDVFRVGIDQELSPAWHVMASAQWTHWSRFQRIAIDSSNPFLGEEIPTNWKNSWLFALGTSYQVTKALTVRLGGAFDETPTIDATRDPRIPGSNRFWVTLGASYQVSQHFSVDGVYEHIFMNDQSINVTQGNITGYYHVSADYKGHADIIGLGLRYTF